MQSLNSIIEQAVVQNATDIYLIDGHSPQLKIDRQMVTIQGASNIDGSKMREELEFWLDEAKIDALNRKENISVVVNTDFGSLRISLFHSNGKVSLHIRPLPSHSQDLSSLNLPAALGVIVNERKGLIIVAGQSASGRSSLIRAMLLERKKSVVVTCEAPIEVPLTSEGSLIIQTDINKDGGIKSVIERSTKINADVIAITEFDKSPDTADAILTAAVSCLVIVECSGNDEVDALRRFQRIIPNSGSDSSRKLISENICALISTKIIPQNSGGLVPVVGITFFNQSCIDRVKSNNLEDLRTLVSNENANKGSQYVDHVLNDYVRKGIFSLEVALEYAIVPSAMKLRAAGIIHKD